MNVLRYISGMDGGIGRRDKLNAFVRSLSLWGRRIEGYRYLLTKVV